MFRSIESQSQRSNNRRLSELMVSTLLSDILFPSAYRSPHNQCKPEEIYVSYGTRSNCPAR